MSPHGSDRRRENAVRARACTWRPGLHGWLVPEACLGFPQSPARALRAGRVTRTAHLVFMPVRVPEAIAGSGCWARKPHVGYSAHSVLAVSSNPLLCPQRFPPRLGRRSDLPSGGQRDSFGGAGGAWAGHGGPAPLCPHLGSTRPRRTVGKAEAVTSVRLSPTSTYESDGACSPSPGPGCLEPPITSCSYPDLFLGNYRNVGKMVFLLLTHFQNKLVP